MTVEPPVLLEAWDHACGAAPAGRAIVLLAWLRADADPDALARLPLGARDALLLRLRQEVFGDRMTCLTACPACGAELEFSVSASNLLQQAGETGAGDRWLEGLGHRIRFRLPDSTDLLALSRFDAGGDEVQTLALSRCVLEAHGPDGAVAAQALPQDVIDLVAQEIERRDPLAAVWFALRCDICGHQWESLFDIASLFWIEVDRRAAALLREVHALASAYGWAEHDVLRMSAARRARYLGMVGA